MKKIGQLGGHYSLYRSILAIVAGILLIAYPDKSLTYVMYVIGVFTIIMGVFTIVSTQKHKEAYSLSQKNMINVNSTINIILGMVLLIAPTFFLQFLMMVIGIVIIIAGLIQIYLLWQRKKIENSVSSILFVIPLLIIVLGAIVTYNPFKTSSMLVQVMGIAILFSGLFELIIRMKILKNKNN